MIQKEKHTFTWYEGYEGLCDQGWLRMCACVLVRIYERQAMKKAMMFATLNNHHDIFFYFQVKTVKCQCAGNINTGKSAPKDLYIYSNRETSTTTIYIHILFNSCLNLSQITPRPNSKQKVVRVNRFL